MAIRINDNSSNFSGQVAVSIGSFSPSFEGTYTADPLSSFDGSLNRALGSFTAKLGEGGWPLNGWALAAGYQISNGSDQFVNDPLKQYNAEKDLVIAQTFGIYDSNIVETQAGWFKGLKEVNPDLKILAYFTHSPISKTASTQVAWDDTNYDLVNDATKGTTQWYLVNSSGDKVQAKFDSNFYRVNCHCVQFQDDNSLGRNFAEQFLQDLYDNWSASNTNGSLLEHIDGAFADVVPPFPQEVYQDGVVPRVQDNRDFDRDGSADGRTDETDGAGVEANYGGARMYRRGAAQWVSIFESIFGSDMILSRNGTRDGFDYDVVSGADPIEDSEFYRTWGGNIVELAGNNLGIRPSATGYDVDFNGFGADIRRTQRVKTSIKVTDHPWGEFGPHCVPAEYFLRNTTWTDIDYEYARFTAACCIFNGVAVAHSTGKNRSFPRLDEYMYPWGNPVGTHPNPGTLNTTTNAFTLRDPDFTSGAANVFFIEFENVLWVLRYDFPPGGADAFGTGASVDIDLPNPTIDVTTKKWQYPDFTSTYTNPNNPLLQTRSQQPSLNDGSEVTDNGAFGSIPMIPAQARMLLRVDA